ncbi:MAG: hypothetical protein IPN77_22385 [Sandaracinaceae bacterium]|nr:hypothetical protein [Sandaracinaceae bacterium]
MKTCDQADLEWRAKGEQEAEANAFAAELLMPSTLALRSCEVSPVSIKLIRSPQKTFVPRSQPRQSGLLSSQANLAPWRTQVMA